MRAVAAWAGISGALLLAALCLSCAHGSASMAAFALINLGLVVYILRR